MLGVNEYFVNLLAALVHLRIFTFQFDDGCPLNDSHPIILKVSDRVPHLEYFSIPLLDDYYKRVGGKLVVCDRKEFPSF
jgi:hypothetical protein